MNVQQICSFFQAGSSFDNLLVEKPDPNDQIGQLNKLGDFLRRIESNERSQSSPGDNAFQSSCDFLLDFELVFLIKLGIGNLFVFINQEIEYFFVELCQAFEVLGIFNLEVDDLIDELTWLDGFVLCFGLPGKLSLQKLSVVGWS